MASKNVSAGGKNVSAGAKNVSGGAKNPSAGAPGDAHIPLALQSPALVITAEPTQVSRMPTFFVGIVDSDYPEGHWRDHCDRIKRLFEITDASLSAEIKVMNRGNQTVDDQQLALDIRRALECINGESFDRMRIVRLGIGGSIVVDVALESLIRGWNIPWTNKNVQIVAVGESHDNHYMNFCKMLRLKELCHSVQYYNTMDYNVFGYVDSNHQLIQHILSQKILRQQIERLGNRIEEDLILTLGTGPED